jgi:hypothetical protein
MQAVAALADPEYQRRVWIDRILPEENYYDELTLNVHILYDDSTALPEPRTAIGDILVDGDEIPRLATLGRILGPMIEELGDAPDIEYLDDNRWPSLVRAAESALAAMVLAGFRKVKPSYRAAEPPRDHGTPSCVRGRQ